MQIENIINSLPDYARDLRLNYSSIINSHTQMSEEQFYGSLLVAAMTSRNTGVIQAIKELTSDKLSTEALFAVNAAVSLMGMNNIYYRFTYLVENPEYAKMPAGLRMNVMRDVANKVDFELYCLVASCITGCGACVASHEKVLINHGLAREVVQMGAKIAGIIHAIAMVYEV